MKFIQMIMSLFMKHKDKLPKDMDSPAELKAKAKEMMDQHGAKLDDLTKKIPGDADDKILNQAKEVLK